MKIAITGATGFIGTNMSQYFESKGYKILGISRKLLSDSNENLLLEVISQSDVVINLAGATINKRWTDNYKKEMRDSRIVTTQKVVDAINKSEKKPHLFISASAVGFYSNTGINDEYLYTKGVGFLSDLCQDWEQEASKVSSDVRLCITRFGVVFANEGGAFEKMALPTKMGLIPIISNGKQLFPWIALVDLIRAIDHIIDDKNISGNINLVAPQILPYKQLMYAIAKRYSGFIPMPVPAFAIKALLGEFGESLTEGQYVVPKKIEKSDFVFKYPTVQDFLVSI